MELSLTSEQGRAKQSGAVEFKKILILASNNKKVVSTKTLLIKIFFSVLHSAILSCVLKHSTLTGVEYGQLPEADQSSLLPNSVNLETLSLYLASIQ